MNIRPHIFFLLSAVALCACCRISPRTYNDYSEDVISRQDLFNTSMKAGVACYRIPSIVTAPNGDLIAAIDERVSSSDDLGENKDINIVIRRSCDNGSTWSPIETVADYPLGQSASDPSMIVDRQTKEVFLFYNYMDLEKEPGIYYLHVKRSRDNGLTWSYEKDNYTSNEFVVFSLEWLTSGADTYRQPRHHSPSN